MRPVNALYISNEGGDLRLMSYRRPFKSPLSPDCFSVYGEELGVAIMLAINKKLQIRILREGAQIPIWKCTKGSPLYGIGHHARKGILRNYRVLSVSIILFLIQMVAKMYFECQRPRSFDEICVQDVRTRLQLSNLETFLDAPCLESRKSHFCLMCQAIWRGPG